MPSVAAPPAPSGFWEILNYEPRPGAPVPAKYFFRNRYVRIVVFMIVTWLTTIVYYGWQHFSIMLHRSGAYSWECTAAERLLKDPCKAQNSEFSTMFFVAMSSEFVCGVVAGVLLDHCGPLLTGLVGHSVFALSWILLIYSTESVQLYIPSMILMGGSVNLVAFPALVLGDFFPKWSGLMVSLVVAAQTAGTSIAIILEAIWSDHPDISFATLVWGYLGFIVLPCAVLYLLTLPVKRPDWTLVGDDGAVVKERDEDGGVELVDRGLYDIAEKEPQKAGDFDGLRTPETDDSAIVADHTSKLEQTVKQPPLDLDIPTTKLKQLSFWKQILTPEYILFCVYYLLQILQFGYYPTSIKEQYGEKMGRFQGLIMPSQAAFGALFGLVVGLVKTLPICFVLIFMITLAYILGLTRVYDLQYFSSVAYVISNSYIYTVKYTYAEEMFPPAHFGVLIGLIGCVAGALGLINIPLEKSFGFVPLSILYIVLGGLCCIICAFLYIRQRKGINYKNVDAPMQLKETLDSPDSAELDRQNDKGFGGVPIVVNNPY